MIINSLPWYFHCEFRAGVDPAPEKKEAARMLVHQEPPFGAFRSGAAAASCRNGDHSAASASGS
ncbi:MAG: hypothetical protein KGM18_14455, partial [Sphingomonadales bacterium]|nr:hypothetical protein [Sphingomonadales bacterium]